MARCNGCGKTWGGAVRCHCLRCHETFSGYGAANLHWGSGKSWRAPGYDAPHHHPSEIALLRQVAGIWTGLGREKA